MSNLLLYDIKFLQGVGPARAQLLAKELNIHTFKDLLYTFPFRYVDKSRFYTIAEIESTSAYVLLKGKILSISQVGEKKGRRLVALFSDGTAKIELVFFQGIKWLSTSLRLNTEYVVFGKPSIFNNTINMVHPELELASTYSQERQSAMVGIYSSSEKLRNSGITNKVFTKLVKNLLNYILPTLEETLPEYIIREHNLISLKDALLNIHTPTSAVALESARYRLKFEELFILQIRLLRQKSVRMNASQGILMPKVGEKFNAVYKKLPFDLTGAQKRVIKEIRSDIISGKQMNRLLQGDVGSGKTMVALLTSLLAVDNGYQCCIMAPTEVLANQHYKSISKMVEGTSVSVELLTGSTKVKERRRIHEALISGETDILIGTHALIEKDVVFKNFGFAVIDEQHRFGVEQRSRLWSKSERLPHVLVMTATPIPRTLAMTLYGDLDVSVIDELPPGRKAINTIHITDNRRVELFNFMRKEISLGRQVFVVYPLIKESEKMDYKNLEEGFDLIKSAFPPPQYCVAVVHGKQKPEDKDFDMQLFASGKANILVATSVIEVGVDVPNASVMVIESAERFGLSQLHQLRGRVGRGSEKSYCILVTGYKLSNEAKNRVELMCSTQDGFVLAEADLKMRGPGDMQGTQQSGLPIDLHISNLSKDTPILEKARGVAISVLEDDPSLISMKNKLIIRQLSDSDNNEILDFSKIS